MAISTNLIKSFQLSALTTALALAGCGGGGGGGGNDTLPPPVKTGTVSVTNPSTGTDSTTTTNLASVKKVQLVSTSSDFYMNVGDSVELTVYALNGNNIGVANVPVNVQITDPSVTGVFSGIGPDLVTDDTGKAVIKLDIKSLTNDQKNYLKQNGLVVTTTVGTVSTSKILKGTDVNATNPTPTVTVSTVNLTGSNIPLIIGSQVKVVATVLDDQKGVVKNTPVTFTLPSFADTGVASLSASTVLTDDKGEAVITLEVKSLTDAQKQALLNGFTINATSNGKPAQALTLKGIKESTIADIANVNLVTNKDTLTTNTGDTINVTAQVRDTNNVSLANMPVSFTLLDSATATGITNTTPLQATTNANGEAVLTLKVGALTPDQKYYLQTSGLSFKATAGAITSSTVTLRTQGSITANSVNTLLLTSDSAIQLAVGSKVKVTALAMDKNGAIVPNGQVSFKVPTDSGLVNNTGAVVNTNANGEATIEVEIKDLAKATTALQNGLVVTAQSGVAVGTTTILSASYEKI